MTGRFEKGHIPVNKGKKGLQQAWNKGTKGIMKPNAGTFKRGLTPWNKGKSGLQEAWNKGTKGICKPNKGSFQKGWNKKIIPQEKIPILTEQEKIKIALDKLEIQRRERIKEFEAKPKEKQTLHNYFEYKICVVEGQYVKCKKQKGFCSYWDFCNKKEENGKI